MITRRVCQRSRLGREFGAGLRTGCHGRLPLTTAGISALVSTQDRPRLPASCLRSLERIGAGRFIRRPQQWLGGVVNMSHAVTVPELLEALGSDRRCVARSADPMTCPGQAQAMGWKIRASVRAG